MLPGDDGARDEKVPNEEVQIARAQIASIANFLIAQTLTQESDFQDRV